MGYKMSRDFYLVVVFLCIQICQAFAINKTGTTSESIAYGNITSLDVKNDMERVLAYLERSMPYGTINPCNGNCLLMLIRAIEIWNLLQGVLHL